MKALEILNKMYHVINCVSNTRQKFYQTNGIERFFTPFTRSAHIVSSYENFIDIKGNPKCHINSELLPCHNLLKIKKKKCKITFCGIKLIFFPIAENSILKHWMSGCSFECQRILTVSWNKRTIFHNFSGCCFSKVFLLDLFLFADNSE